MRHSLNVILRCLALTLFLPAGSADALTDLVIEKTADVDSIEPGGLITYTLIIHNQTLDPARDVFIYDPLPDGLSLVSWDYVGSSSGEIVQVNADVWCTDYMQAWLTYWVDITAQLDPSYSLDTLENTAWVSTSDPEGNYSNNESVVFTTVVPEPATALLVLVGLGSLARWGKRRSSPTGLHSP